MPGEHTQEYGSDDVVSTATTIAGVTQRAMFHELFPAPACVEELKEEDELAIASGWCVLVLFGVESPAGSVQRPRLEARKRGVGELTLRVSAHLIEKRTHHPQSKRLAPVRSIPHSRF